MDILSAYRYLCPLTTTILLLAANRYTSQSPIAILRSYIACTAVSDSDCGLLPEVVPAPQDTIAPYATWFWIASLAMSLVDTSRNLSRRLRSKHQVLPLKNDISSHGTRRVHSRGELALPLVSLLTFLVGLCVLSIPVLERGELSIVPLVLGWFWVFLSILVLLHTFIRSSRMSAVYYPPSYEALPATTSYDLPSEKERGISPDEEAAILNSLRKMLSEDLEPSDAIDAVLEALSELLREDIRIVHLSTFLDLHRLSKRAWRAITTSISDILAPEIGRQMRNKEIDNQLVWSAPMKHALILLLSSSDYSLPAKALRVLASCMTPNRMLPILLLTAPYFPAQVGPHTFRLVLQRFRVGEVLPRAPDLADVYRIVELLAERYLFFPRPEATFGFYVAHQDELEREGVVDIIMPLFASAITSALHPDLASTNEMVDMAMMITIFYKPYYSWSSRAIDVTRDLLGRSAINSIIVPRVGLSYYEDKDRRVSQLVVDCFLQSCPSDQATMLQAIQATLSYDWPLFDRQESTLHPLHPLKSAKLCAKIFSATSMLPLSDRLPAEIWRRLWDSFTSPLDTYARWLRLAEDIDDARETLQIIRSTVGTGDVLDSLEEWAEAYADSDPDDRVFTPDFLDAMLHLLKPAPPPSPYTPPLFPYSASPYPARTEVPPEYPPARALPGCSCPFCRGTSPTIPEPIMDLVRGVSGGDVGPRAYSPPTQATEVRDYIVRVDSPEFPPIECDTRPASPLEIESVVSDEDDAEEGSVGNDAEDETAEERESVCEEEPMVFVCRAWD